MTLEADVAAVREGRSLDGTESSRWSCGKSRQIKKGARLFLMKQGAEPRGILGSARATSDVFEDPTRSLLRSHLEDVQIVWVAGRHASVADVLTDVLGAAVGVAVDAVLARIASRSPQAPG